MQDDQDTGSGALVDAFGEGAATQRAYAAYRISPLGAHTDHQHGLTCGFTLDRGVTVVWRACPGAIRLLSADRPGVVECDLEGNPAPGTAEVSWAAYPLGVVRALARRGALATGIEGHVRGTLPPGGISTSAALQAAVLRALCVANGLRLAPMEAAQLIVDAERASAGVSVGLLDPAVILHGRDDAIVFVDCRERTARLHRWARGTPPMSWFLVDSGVPRDLRTSPYNERVSECREVCHAVGLSGQEAVLRDVTPEAYRRRRRELSPTLIKRAEHYFSEVKRVKLAKQAIARGDVVGFGRLIKASADSLTSNFECGVPETRELLTALNASSGVHGASYAGGGWGGLVQVLAEPGSRGTIEAVVAGCQESACSSAAESRIWEVAQGAGRDGR